MAISAQSRPEGEVDSSQHLPRRPLRTACTTSNRCFSYLRPSDFSVEFKDYYATLGVPRTASADELKKAFRKLARQYHPDVAKDKKTAEAKFKEINEAHEVLSDPEKRQRYDTLGARWQEGSGPAPFQRGRRPSGTNTENGDFEFNFGGSTGFSDFFEQFFGQRSRTRRAPVNDDGDEEAGSFFSHRRARRGQDIEGDILVTLREVLKGSERTVSLQRTHPQTGAVDTQTLKVKIPAGVEDGQTIRVRGKGGEGSGKGAPGDLLLHVRLAADPDFRVEGADLHCDLTVYPWDAVLGVTEPVPTLSGKIALKIPPGSEPGQSLRIKGHGLPTTRDQNRGDLYVTLGIKLPTTLSPEERALWEKLRESAKHSV